MNSNPSLIWEMNLDPSLIIKIKHTKIHIPQLTLFSPELP